MMFKRRGIGIIIVCIFSIIMALSQSANSYADNTDVRLTMNESYGSYTKDNLLSGNRHTIKLDCKIASLVDPNVKITVPKNISISKNEESNKTNKTK